MRRAYGAHPVHLLVLLAGFALAGYAVWFTAGDPLLPRMALWFGGALIGHDSVLFPLYALADRILGRLPGGRRSRPSLVPPRNYLRVPALASALLLLVFLPGIIEQGAGSYLAATGQTQAPFLGRWLLITAALFALSGGVYAVRRVRAR